MEHRQEEQLSFPWWAWYSLQHWFNWHPDNSGCANYHKAVEVGDDIPMLAQIRTLDLLEQLKKFHRVMCFTSNDDLENFEGRFLSRVKPHLFPTQGIAKPAKDWLLRTARPRQPRIIKLSCNNLRRALQQLKIRRAERNAGPLAVAPSLPVITARQLTTAGEPVANSRQASFSPY